VAGFSYAVLAGDPPSDLTKLSAPDGTPVYVDGFAFTVSPSA
jgi:hypothetical protein